jgi:hypothetical protein
VAPARPGQRAEGEVWLTVDPPALRLRGNGKDEATVQVRAWKQVGGVPVDASREVWPTRSAADPRKILLPGSPGELRFTVRARHAGNLPHRGTVTVEARGPRGPLVPVAVAVEVTPVELRVRIRAWKAGFLAQSVDAVLPGVCDRVTGVVEGGALPPAAGAPPPAATGDRRVVAAHVTAALSVDGGSYSTPVEVRSAGDGGFWFGLPPALVQTYGSDATSHPLPAPIELGLDDEVRKAAELYVVAVADWRNETQHFPASAALVAVRDRCSAYPQALLEQLRRREEAEHGRILSALHRLRKAVRFALKYRRDYRYQRFLLDSATGDLMASGLDALTDLIPVAELFQSFLSGATQTFQLGKRVVTMPPGGVRRFLELIAGTIEDLPVIGWIGSAFRALLWVARKATGIVQDLMRVFYTGLIDLAEAQGLSAGHLRRLLEWDPGGYRLDLPPGLTGFRRSVAELSKLLEAMPVLLGKTLAAVAYLVLTVACAGVKMAGQALALLDWSPAYKGWQGTVGEILEDWLGKLAGTIYENAGGEVERQVARVGAPPAGAAARAEAPARTFADVVMDAVGSRDAFDDRCARALAEACDRSLGLRVAVGWREHTSGIARLESEDMRRLQVREANQETLETFSRWGKLLVKIVQAVVWAWGVVGKAALYAFTTVAGYVARKSGVPGPVVEQAVDSAKAADLTARLETLVDLVDLGAIRLPIWIKEVLWFGYVYNLASVRVSALYADGER